LAALRPVIPEVPLAKRFELLVEIAALHPDGLSGFGHIVVIFGELPFDKCFLEVLSRFTKIFGTEPRVIHIRQGKKPPSGL